VPIGYLFTVALLALCTFCAVAPPRPAHTSPTNAAYTFGFVVNELPFVATAALVASTALAAAQGDLTTPVGWIGFALAVLSVAGLAVVARRGTLARAVLAEALDVALGFGDGSRPSTAVPRRHPWARILLAPLPVRPRAVERIRDVSYGPDGRRNRLDVYRSPGASGGPVLVHLHGGGFRHGRRSREARPLLHRLARQGWVCISADYRLRPEATFPDPLIDTKRVVAWARGHGGEYGADTSTLFVAGSSAGGHLATMAALTPNDAALQPGFEHADTSVSGVVALYAFYGAPDARAGVAASPADHLRPDAPPFFGIHGERDTLVLVADARRFADALRRRSSNPVLYAELPGAQHGFDLFHSCRFEAVVDAIEVFAARVRAGRPA
jgi:acetyl esterase/lipase